MIELSDVQKRFGNTQAVQSVSFTAQPGMTLGVLGPNGAGKTTTLRMLYGLIKPDAGSVLIDNIDVTKHPIDAQKKLGILPDNSGLYTRLTAAENITYFAELYGLSRQRIRERIQELSEQLDMGEILHRPTQGFSQGERMKVALARALVHEPPYLILDEPTNGLDVVTTLSVRQLLQTLKNTGIGIIFSSHLMHEVSNLCDQLVIITDGKVAASGTEEAICQLTQQPTLETAFAHFCRQKPLQPPHTQHEVTS